MTDAVQERVLLVEDDDSLRQLLVAELEDRGLQVRALASAEEAVGSWKAGSRRWWSATCACPALTAWRCCGG